MLLLGGLGLLLLVASNVFHIASSKLTHYEKKEKTIKVLKQVKQAMDNEIKHINRVYLRISSDPVVQDYLYAQKPASFDQRSTEELVMKSLNKYKAANPSILDVYMYVKSSQSIVSTQAVETPEHFFSNQLYHSMEYATWQQLLKSYQNKNYLYLGQASKDSFKSPSLALFQSLPLTDPTGPDATIVIVFKPDSLQSILDTVDPDLRGTVMITDKYDEVLLSSQARKAPDAEVLDEMIGDSGVQYMNENGIKVVLFYLKSTNPQMTYITIIPEHLLDR
ncbi:cache domain-containing protein [Paenibacillus sp. 1_12]|uniref:cache domain-containing protein n=1 Tax=Paenibacillus sp. 1_12 TaxID=1566278 RepID=UPI001C493E01|nr:cache domain-containing protein [Paenibacillus sp. 1_12]